MTIYRESRKWRQLFGAHPDLSRTTHLNACPMQAMKDVSPRTQEARMRNSKFLAEFTKFRLCPYGTFFTLLKV